MPTALHGPDADAAPDSLVRNTTRIDVVARRKEHKAVLRPLANRRR